MMLIVHLVSFNDMKQNREPVTLYSHADLVNKIKNKKHSKLSCHKNSFIKIFFFMSSFENISKLITTVLRNVLQE